MKVRLAALVIVLVIQLAVPALYGGSAAAESPFLDAEDLVDDRSQHVGEEVVLYGQVESLDPVVVNHRLDDDSTARFTVVGLDRQLATGQYIEVYGIVESERVVSARRSVVRGEREHWYTYGISLFAVVVVFGLTARDWTVNTEDWVLEPREDQTDA